MGVVDVSRVSLELFITGIVFILAIGSFLSLGVLRLVQLRRGQGILFLVLSVVSFLLMLLVLEMFFLD